MANYFLTNFQIRKIKAGNVIFHNLYMSKYIQEKKHARKVSFLEELFLNASKIVNLISYQYPIKR